MKTKILLSVLSRRQAILRTAITRFLGIGLVCLCFAAQAWGETFTDGDTGTRYTILTANTVAVAQWTEKAGKYSGDWTIPSEVVRSVSLKPMKCTVVAIGDNAFIDCTDLTSVTISNTVTSIGNSAFEGCTALTSITLPSSITSIGTRAFSNCSDLTSFEVEWETPLVFPTESYTIGIDYANCTLIVPLGTVALYRAADVWKNFSVITDGTEDSTVEDPATEDPATEDPTEEEPATEEPTEEEPVTEEPTEEDPATEEPTEEEPALSVDNDTITFKADGSIFKIIKITTKLDWEIITDVDWISFVPKTSGTGNGEVLVIAESNDGEERETTITVATEADSAYIYVSQASDIPSYALHFELEGAYYYSPDTTLSTEVEVVAPDAGSYAGTVVIPSTATYSGKDYAVTTIGAEAFAASDLTNVTLPLSLTAVGDDAFKDCAVLDSVEILWTSLTEAYPDGIIYAFDGVNLREVTLTVPAGMKDIYKVAHFWGAFGTIVERERESSTSTAKATEAITVRATSGKLYVDSPVAESVYIYSFTGKLLYTATKASGAATFNAPSEKLVIVRGTSGWARKVMN
jgi:hypothetical protein